MKYAIGTSPECRSVFHSGESTTKERYTQVWVRLINQLEKTGPSQQTSIDQEQAYAESCHLLPAVRGRSKQAG